MKCERTADERASLAREIRGYRRLNNRGFARLVLLNARTCDDNGLPASWYAPPLRRYVRDDEIIINMIGDPIKR